MKFRYITIFVLVAPILCDANEWFEGENLLVEPPNSELFDTYAKNEPGWKLTMWQSKLQHGGDTFVVNILSGKPARLRKFRESQDKPGKDAFGEFLSELIDSSNRNGYKSVLWETSCEIQGMNIRSIQLAIAGRDSLYHIRKLWKVSVTEDEYSNWKATINDISLCDTRRESNSCPEGYRRAKDS